MHSTEEDCAIDQLPDPLPTAWRAPVLFRAYGDRANSSSAWVLLVTSVLTAGALAYALSGLLSGDRQTLAPPSLRWGMALLRAITSVSLTTAAGAADVWILWHVLSAKPRSRPASLSRHALAGWIFLPAIVLLEREQSLGLLPVVALATAALAASLRCLFPTPNTEQTEQTEQAHAHAPGELQTLYGLPQNSPDEARPAPSFFIAACAQTSLLMACAGALTPAGILLMAALAPLVWTLTPVQPITRRRALAGMLALALLVTVLAQLPQIPWTDRRPHSTDFANASLHSHPKNPALAKRYDANYVGIILWPPPKKHTELYAPLPSTSAFRAGAPAQPLVIPFDGAYWYFQAPRSEPGAQAHIAHGKPTDAGINPRSTNESALLMEAQQTLPKAIDARCCREIDVTLTNADTLSGSISLGLRLSNSIVSKPPSLLLGVREIPSSDLAPIPAGRGDPALPDTAVARPPPVRQDHDLLPARAPAPWSEGGHTELHPPPPIAVHYPLSCPADRRDGLPIQIESTK
jgi:hypothetical protein